MLFLRFSSREPRLWPATISVLAAVALALCGPAVAADKKWAGVHEGGFVTAVAIDPATPSRVYAATARGLFASMNDGENWKPLSHGLAGHFVGALAIDPGPPAALYLGTNAGGLLRSTAGDEKW